MKVRTNGNLAVQGWADRVRETMDNSWFFEKFELIADLPDAIPRMRELVFSLAIQGKLVPQAEPDSFEQSNANHEISDSDRKQAKWNLAEGHDSIPYSTGDLPSGWILKTVEQIGRVNPRNTADDGTPVGFAQMSVIPTDFGKPLVAESRLWGEVKKGYTHFADGDVVVAKITPCFQNGKACVVSNLPSGIGAGTTELHVIRPNLDIADPRYLLICFKSPEFIEGGVKSFTGTAGQQRVSNEYFRNRPIPLPPLSEQHRIVSKVEELLGICDRLEVEQREREVLRGRLVSGALKRFTDTPSVENLGYLFHGSYGVSPSDLRKTILTLAVQGKLVPQDPKEEPASKLIHRITSEKSDLIKSKMIRASSAHTKRDYDSTDGELPNGWMWVRIDEITSVGTGSTPLKSRRDFYEKGDVPWVTSAATNNEFIKTPEQFVTQKAVRECNLRIYPKGSLLIALYGQGKTRGQVGQLMFDSTTNQACAVLEFFASGESVRDYIRLFFLKKYDELREQAAGGAQPNLSGGMIRLTKVPLPPLAEQRRIVAKVEELMTMVDKLEQMELQTRQRSASLLDAIVHRLSASAG